MIILNVKNIVCGCSLGFHDIQIILKQIMSIFKLYSICFYSLKMSYIKQIYSLKRGLLDKLIIIIIINF